MKPSLEKVLTALRRKKSKGVTFSDFPIGTELRKRLMELRQMGYEFAWQWELQDNGGRHKRTFLIREPN